MKSTLGKISEIMILLVIMIFLIVSFKQIGIVRAEDENQSNSTIFDTFVSETIRTLENVVISGIEPQTFNVNITESVKVSENLITSQDASEIFISVPKESDAEELFKIPIEPISTVLTADTDINPILKNQSTLLWCDYRSKNVSILNADVKFEIGKNIFVASYNSFTKRYEYNYTSGRAGNATVYCHASAENFESKSTNFDLITEKINRNSRFVSKIKGSIKLLKENLKVSDIENLEDGIYKAEIEIPKKAWAVINGLNIIDDTNIIAQADDIKPSNSMEEKILTPVFSLDDSEIEFENAEIILEKRGEINKILRCDQWNFNDFKCDSKWIPTEIPFNQNSTYVWFNVSSFSAYAGANITILNPYTFVRDNENWTVAFNTTGEADLIINSTNANWTEFLTDDNSTKDEMKFLEIKCGENSLMNSLEVIDENNVHYNYSQLTEFDSIKIKKLLIRNYSCDETGYITNNMLIAGYAILQFNFGDQVAYAYDAGRTTFSDTSACSLSPSTWICSGNAITDCTPARCALESSGATLCKKTCASRANTGTGSSANCVMSPASGIGTCASCFLNYCYGSGGPDPNTGPCSITTNQCDYTCSGTYVDCDLDTSNGCECDTSTRTCVDTSCLLNNGQSCSFEFTCVSGHCHTDYAGGKYCAQDSTSCVHTGSQYASGTYAPDCYSTGGSGTPGSRRICSSASWIEASPNCGYQSQTCVNQCDYGTVANSCSSGSCQTGGAGDTTPIECDPEGCSSNNCNSTCTYGCGSTSSQCNGIAPGGSAVCSGGNATTCPSCIYTIGACSVSQCSAECAQNSDCSNKCSTKQWYSSYSCSGSCACNLASPTCSISYCSASCNQGTQQTGGNPNYCQACSNDANCQWNAQNQGSACDCSADHTRKTCSSGSCSVTTTCDSYCGADSLCNNVQKGTTYCNSNCNYIPSTVLSSPENTTYNNNTIAFVNVTCSGYQASYTVNRSVDSGASVIMSNVNNNTLYTNSTTLSSLSDGPHNIRVSCYNGNYINTSSIVYFTIHKLAPTYSNNQTNTTIVGEPSNFTLNWADNVQLAGYIFSNNNSGTWVNSSYISFSGTTNTSWNVTILNSTARTVVAWCFYANDTSGNMNNTNCQPGNQFILTTLGKSNVTVYLNPSTITYPQTTVINCTVRDANSSSTLSDYHVWIYDGSTLLTQVNTDSNGNVTYTYQPSAATTLHNINCNITNNATLFYNAISNGTAQLTVNKGTPTPNIYLNDVAQNLTINWTDSYTVKGNWSSQGGTDLTWNLYNNTSIVATGNPAVNNTQLASGVYEFVYNTSGGNNWTIATTQKLYLTVLKKWNQTDGIIANASYYYDLNTLGIPIAKQELSRTQDSSRITLANGTAYSVIPINATWNSSAYVTGPNANTTFTNVNVTLSSCPSGWTCDLSSWIILTMNNTYQITNTTNSTMNKNNVILGYQTQWGQNTTAQSNISIQYINTTVSLTSSDTINYYNVNYTHPIVCPNGFTCSGFSSSIPTVYNVLTTGNITYYSGSGNVIIASQNSWNQDPTRTSTQNVQYINSTVNLTRNDTAPSINFVNVQYSSTSACPSPFNIFAGGGPAIETTYNVPTTGNKTIYNCSGNTITVILPINGWQQNRTNTTQTISSQDINLTINFTRNDSTGIIFNNIYYALEDGYWCPPGYSCIPIDPQFVTSWYIPQSGNTSKFEGYGNAIDKTAIGWQQNLTAQSTIDNVYLNQSLSLTNHRTFDLYSLNYSYSDWSCSGTCPANCPSGFTCSGLNGTVSYVPGNDQTTTLWANASGNVIDQNQANWSQNTTATSNLTTQFINSTVRLLRTDGSTINFVNIQYLGLMQCNEVSTTFSGDNVPSLYNVPTTNNTSYYKCSGDVLNQTWLNWQQDLTRTTIAGGTAYVTRNITIYDNATNPYMNFTNVQTNWQQQNRTSPWTCSGISPDIFNVNYSSWNNITMIMNCSANNNITKQEGSWVADNSTEQNITNQKIIKSLNGINTDPEVSYVNVNATYTSQTGFANQNETSPFTIASITANGGTWYRGISATNTSQVINTTLVNRYSAPEYYQNISINDTGNITFYNLTGWSLSFSDANITAGTDYIKYWNGTQWVYITPTSSDNNCNTSTPVYTANITTNGTFYVCKRDLNGNGKIDYFKFKIPRTFNTSIQLLQVGGLDTTYPQFNNNGTNTILPNYNATVLIYANWSDDAALSKAWLWTNETGGNGRNYTDLTYGSPVTFSSNPQWSNFTWRNASILPGTLISWKIYANDTTNNQNVTEGSFRIWGWANVTEISPSGNLSRTVNPVTCRVMDANRSIPIENYTVNFYKNESLITNLTNSSGYAVWYYNSTPDWGLYIIKCNITDNETLYYNDSVNQMNSTVYVWRTIYLNLTINPTQIYRHSSFTPYTSTIQAYVYDDNSTKISSQQVCFYRKFPNNNTLASLSCNNTDTNGITTYTYNGIDLNGENSDWPPQNYTIFVNHTFLDYSIQANNTTYLVVKGKLYPSISSPSNESRYYKNQIVNLNSGTDDEYLYSVTPNTTNWTLNTGELLNQSATGTWNVSINHNLGNFTVNYSVTKDWFDSNWTSVIISLFGYSGVNETGPTLVYRQSTNANFNGTVYDRANNTGISNYICRWWVNATNDRNSTTNSSGICNYTWTSTCSDAAGPYFVNVSIGNNSSIFYDYQPGYEMATLTVNLTGNLSTSIIIPSTNTIWHRGETVSVNSSVKDDCGTSFDNNSVNARWYLESLTGPGINSTMSIPISYSRGQKTLVTNVTKDYHVLGNNSTTVYVYGWANITNITPSYENVPKGALIVVACHVKDANTSENLANYPVNFYKNDNLNNTNLTNSSGYAVWHWNTISDEPGVNYSINCSIFNNETLFYNISYPSNLNTTIELSSGLYIDNFTKSADTISRNTSYTYSPRPNTKETIITAYIRQEASTPSEGANCSIYNSTSYLNSSLTNSSGYCNVTYDPVDDTIPDNYTISINATKSGYSSSETNQTIIEIKGYIPYSNYNIIYPTDNQKFHRGDNSWFNSTIQDENYNYVINVEVYWRNGTSVSDYQFAPLAGYGNGTDYGTIPINHPLGNSTSPIKIYEIVSKSHYYSPTQYKSNRIVIWGWSNVSTLQPSSGNINRGTNVNILCRVTDANTSELLSDYQIKFWNDSTNIYNSNSNSTGFINYTWNTTLVSVGLHLVNCTVPQNETKYYDGASNVSSITVNLIGNLTTSLTSISHTAIYRNDSWSISNSKNYSSNITVRVVDEYSNAVNDSNVSFYQNESFLGNCTTNSSGYCIYTYNPVDTLTPGNYSIKFNSSKQYYYSSSTLENFIAVYGHLIPNITNYPYPKIYRNDTTLLNSTTKDENGVTITPSTTTWNLITAGHSVGNAQENTSWTVNLNERTGTDTLQYRVNKQWYDQGSDVWDTENIEIWTKANITLYSKSPSGDTQNRGTSITYYANVTDHFNNSYISNYNCSWWLDGLNINISLTNSQGTCNWTWNTGCVNATRDYTGLHTINSTIGSNSIIYYDTNVNSSNTSTVLKGNLSIRIISPINNNVSHKTDQIWLNSTITDECSQSVTTTINWTLNNSQVLGTQINTSWSIPSNQTPGPYFINLTVSNSSYYSAYNTSNITIWGWSNVSWIYPPSTCDSTPCEYGHGQVLAMTCKVLDVNNSTGVSGYNVTFWKNGNYNGSNLTISGGNVTLNWDTSEGLGLYAWKCNITDNATLYYNKSVYESTINLNITDSIPPRVENLTINPSTLEANYNTTNITVDVWDSVQRDKVWIMISNSTNILVNNASMTNLSGNTFNYTFRPTTGGLHNVTVYANDSSGNTNSTRGNFTVIGNTTGLILQSPYPSETATGITLYNNYTFSLNVTLNNTGNGTMRFVNVSLILPTGIYANSTSEQCSQNISPGYNCTKAFTINVTSSAALGNNYIYSNFTWQNPDYSISYTTNSTQVSIQSNPVLQVDKGSIENNVTHGTSKNVGSYNIQNIGNTQLWNVTMNASGGNMNTSWISYSTSPQSWLTLPNYILKGQNQTINIIVTVPSGYSSGIYWTNVTVNSTGSYSVCSPSSNCFDSLILNITVPQDWNWTLTPTRLNLSVQTETSGSFDITINNTGNININYSLSCSGTDLFPSPFDCPPNSNQFVYVYNLTSTNITFTYNAIGVTGGIYTTNITISNSSANPTQNFTYVTFNVTDTPPQINAVISPLTVDINYQSVDIRANVTDNIGINYAWINITRPDGSIEILNVTYVGGSGYKEHQIFYNYTPNASGNYSVRIYANDTQTIPAGTNYSQLLNFTVVGNTAINIQSNVSTITIYNITQNLGSSFGLNISVNNTGLSGAYFVNQSFELPSGWSASPSSFNYNNLTLGTYRSNSTTITIPKATQPATYLVNATVNWTNPNNTVSINRTTINVIVASNPVIDIAQSSLSMTLKHGNYNSTYFTLNSTGNTQVSDISISCVYGNCTNLSISFNESSISSLDVLNTRIINVSASVPLGFSPGDNIITINASGTGTSDAVNLTVTVPSNSSWGRDPDNFSQISVGLNTTGDIGIINITNYGNIPLTFNISTSGNGTSYISTNATSISVNKQSSGYVRVNYSSPDSITESSNVTAINVSIYNSTADPSYSLNTTASIKIYRFMVVILSPTQTNPTNNIYTGNITEIHANATIGDSIIGNLESGESITWAVKFNTTDCPLNSTPTYNQTGKYWIITCTAPTLTDALNYTLIVASNYSNNTGGIVNVTSTDSEPNAIFYKDITPPNIIPYVDSVSINSTVSIRANVTDNLAVSKAIAEITYPNSTKTNYTMTNISTNRTWEHNLTNAAYGDYDVKVYANDTTNNWNSNTTWFEVYNPNLAWFNGTTLDKENIPVMINFSLYRPNATSKLYNFSSNASGNYSQQIKIRYYDFNILAFNNTMNLTNVSITGNVGNNTAAPISLDNIPTSEIGGRVSKAMYVQTILNYTSALLVLNYSGNSYVNENYLGIYRCSNWNPSNRSCNSASSWSRIASTLYTTPDILIASNIMELSGTYAAAEFICGDSVCDTTYGESFAWCTADCHCGNGVCDFSETSSSCPSDCGTGGTTGGGGGGGGGGGTTVTPPEVEVATPITLTTTLLEIKLKPGEYQTTSIGITNNQKEDTTVSLSVEGDIFPYTMFEKDKIDIKAKDTIYAKVKFFTMPTTIPGVYNGYIIVKSKNGAEQRISVILRVEYEREKLLDIKVEPITKEVMIGDTFKYQVTLYNLGLTKRVDVYINYTIKSVDTDKIIAINHETMAVDTSLSFMRSIDIPESTEGGLYTIEAVAWYENRTASSVASFNVVKAPWIMTFLIAIFTNWITYLILFILIPTIYFGYRYYERWKMEKIARARYIRPIDLKKLPVKGLFIGKVAETNTDAYFDENKLTTHMIVAGGTGSGKSVAAMIMAEECLKKGIPVIVFDPTAQWTGFVRRCTDKDMLKTYPKFGMKEEESRSFKGTIIDITDPFLKVEVEKYIKEGEITVFVLNRLTADQLDYFVRKTIDYMFSIQWPESRKLKLLVVYDEIHRLLPKYAKEIGATLEGGGYLAVERACREFRKWGIGLVMISQVLLDFKGAIRAVIATETQMRTKYEGDVNRIKTKYGWEYATTIPKLEIGTGMIQNPEYNDGKPWFIRFRPLLHDTFRLSEEELDTYESYTKQIAELEEKIEKLKSKGIDTYDMELELKLAIDKVKTAQMRMAETYIDSIKTRMKTLEERQT